MATQGVVNPSGGNYGFSGRTMTNSQVRAIGWNHTISSGASIVTGKQIGRAHV